MNKKGKKFLKRIIIVLLIILAILIFFVYREKMNNSEITIDNLPQKVYTEENSKDFYTKALVKYLDVFQNDFHIKYLAETTDENGKKTESREEFSKKGNVSALYLESENDRMVFNDKYFYHVNEDEMLVTEMPNDGTIGTKMDVLFYSLESINRNFVKTGNEEIAGSDYYYEEYKMATVENTLVRFYFDADKNMKYIKAYKSDDSMQIFYTIEMLEKETYDFMFDLSNKYTIYEIGSDSTENN